VSKADAGGDLEFFTRSVRFRVDGKPYIGCLDLDALGELQKIWGLTSLADMQKRVENVQLPEMKDIVSFPCCAISPRSPRPTGTASQTRWA
jgi:hypothetical protein